MSFEVKETRKVLGLHKSHVGVRYNNNSEQHFSSSPGLAGEYTKTWNKNISRHFFRDKPPLVYSSSSSPAPAAPAAAACCFST